MSRSEYLSFCAAALLGLASCASTPSAAPTNAAPTAGPNVSPEQIAQAKRAGYTVVVTKSGSTLFCQKSTKTGSHMVTNECRSAQEWDSINEQKGDAAAGDLGNAQQRRTQAPGN